MVYYLLLKGDTEKDVIFETNVLGEESFGVFYPSMGFQLLNRIIQDVESDEFLEEIKIVNEQNKKYSVVEFLDKIGKLRIKKA